MFEEFVKDFATHDGTRFAGFHNGATAIRAFPSRRLLELRISLVERTTKARTATILATFLTLQEFRQRPKLSLGEVIERRHDGTPCVGRRVFEMTDKPFVGAPACSFHAEIRPDVSAFTVKSMTHEASFLAIECPSVFDQVGLWLFRGRAGRIEAGKVVDEEYELPGIGL